MDETMAEALRSAADDGGVDHDGLEVYREDGGYAFVTPETRREGLDADELASVATDSEYVDSWYLFSRPRLPARTAFLRWVEHADERPVPERYDALRSGVVREWGQLRIEARLAEGAGRRYEVRHEADADRPLADLERHTDPLAAREIVTFDDRGRYRPLKTAPTLPTGWAFVDLSPDDLTATVSQIYPATVENWHREREGELDVDHWRETMERQTGIYGVVKTWDRGEGHEHVDWVAEACCDDSQCLKRREWQYDADTPLDVDGGDGVFPCREPCSLVVSAARRWTRLEAETERTYEFDLTPSEKAQLEELVDAVSEGRVDEIREADFSEGANRWRTRFLRAKRTDEEGNLCGVPTGDGEDET